MLALATINQWYLKQLNVNNAFLHGDLNEKVYMVIPQGMQVTKPRQVCKLQRSLYGLKQASRPWYARLSSFLISHAYKQCASNHSLFLKHGSKTITTLLVYVDDIVLSSNNLTEIQSITQLLDNTFKIKDLGDLRYFLGFEVARKPTGIDLRTLLSTEDASSFGRLMGRLIYLTNTRLNITYVVQHLSQFVVTPILAHQQVAFRIHRYLKGTPGAGIFLFAASNIHLKGFSDPNWVGCIDNRRFLTDYVVYIVDSLIS